MIAPAPLKRAARAMFHRTGGLHLARWMNRKGLRILMYHRFPDARGLDAQCRHLREWYDPISLTEAARRLQSGEPLPPNSIAVTVDDGYRDFAEIAYPVFRSHAIPVTVYLVTGFLDGALWLWVDQVRYAFRHTRKSTVRLELPQPVEFSLASEEQRETAARQVCEALKLVPSERRQRILASLAETLETAIPAAPPADCAPLSWEAARAMAAGGVEFGAHTESHPILSQIDSAADLQREIAGSKRRLEEMLDAPARHFCYPNGRPRDIGPDAVEAVRRAGFHTAVTTVPGVNSSGTDLLDLRRIAADPGYESGYFQRCVAAARA